MRADKAVRRERIILAHLGLADRLAARFRGGHGVGWSRRSTATTLTALRFFQDLKQKQVGCELGYSQMHISRMLRRALRQMHEQLMS